MTSLAAGLLAATVLLTGCSKCGGPAGIVGVPEQVVRHNNLGTSMLSQQKWGEAAAEFRKGLEVRPEDPVLLNNTAVALLQQGEPEEAEELLRAALTADPDHPYAHYNLGLIERNRGNFPDAAVHFEKVAAFDSEEVFTQYSLGATLARVDRPEDAERALRKALELNPTHVSSLYALGRLLVTTGRQEAGIELINRSQEIRTRSGIDEAVGHQYGEQGPYALGVDYPGGGLEAPPAIAVTFTAQGGGTPPSTDYLSTAWTTYVTDGGVASVIVAGPGEIRQFDHQGDRVIGSPGARTGVQALTTGDIDGDDTLELVALVTEQVGEEAGDWGFAVRMLTVGGEGGLVWRPESLVTLPPLPRGGYHSDLALVDRDHDGDVDLFFCWGLVVLYPGAAAGDESSTSSPIAGCALATNDGNGRFELDTSRHGVAIEPGRAAPVSLAFSDIDNDRDIDLLAATPRGIRLFSNDRDGTFSDVSHNKGLGSAVQGAASLAVADFDKDGWMDLVVGTAEGPVLLLNQRGSFPLVQRLHDIAEGEVSAPPQPADDQQLLTLRSAVTLDFDNDGFIDIAAADASGSLVLYRNVGARAWRRVESPWGPAGAPVAGFPLTALDADGDGDQDLIVSGNEAARILINEGGSVNNWLTIQPKGVNDNLYGIGTKIEVLAGALRQKFEITSPLPLHVGLGEREMADAVRLLWPGGVLQDELNQPAKQTAQIAQLDRKGTSCPLLYAWRDGGWEFVTDFLGGCAIGYQHAPGVFSVPDTDEYVKVEGGLTERDGEVRLRLNNQLEEVIWFDQAQLVVVDHPRGTEVYPNERLMPGPPWPEFELFASADVRPIARALDPDTGHVVTEWLRENDRRYVTEFDWLPFKGYAEMHTLEIDLGKLPPGRRTVLLLDGWIDYADSTANVAAAQAGLSLVPPRLYAADGAGSWREIEGLMGFPAGLPKTMAVDLTGHVAPSDPRIRIETNMRIYWDRARVMVGGEDVRLQVTRVRAEAAELRFGGFPKETSVDGRKPYGYDPNHVQATSSWKAHVGAYTPFGDVTGLVGRIDDRFVTTKNGDEIELTFRVPGPAPKGWTRTYLLYADGFGKDMDPNSAANNEVGPIPFHGMPNYPYGPGVTPPVHAGGDPPARMVSPAADGLPDALPLDLRRRNGGGGLGAGDSSG